MKYKDDLNTSAKEVMFLAAFLCLFVCGFVCLFVCLFVGLLAT